MLNSTLPVGTVLQSMLTEQQMNSTSAGTWYLLDGRSCSGTAYESLTGNATVADVRGRFLRMKDHGAGVNPDGDVALGTNQADEFKSHFHTVASRNTTATGTGGSPPQGSPVAEFLRNTNTTGGAETRPTNTTVNFFIRID